MLYPFTIWCIYQMISRGFRALTTFGATPLKELSILMWNDHQTKNLEKTFANAETRELLKFLHNNEISCVCEHHQYPELYYIYGFICHKYMSFTYMHMYMHSVLYNNTYVYCGSVHTTYGCYICFPIYTATSCKLCRQSRELL